MESRKDWLLRTTAEAEAVLKKIGVEDWVTLARKRQWRWACKVFNHSEARWTAKTIHWKPQEGLCSVGHPRKKWLDPIEKFASSCVDIPHAWCYIMASRQEAETQLPNFLQFCEPAPLREITTTIVFTHDDFVPADYDTTCTVLPMSGSRISWDLLGFAFISYDMITFPFIEAFGVEQQTWINVMDLITLSYWMIDLCTRFFVGYYEDGVLEMRLRCTAMRYFKTSFFFDFLVVGLDMPLTIMGKHEQMSSTLRLGKLTKTTRLFAALRVLRGVKLMRIMKFDQFFSQASTTARTELSSIMVRFGNLVLLMILVNHLFACIWYAIGVSGWDDEYNWVTHYNMDQKDVASRYLQSLHWSLTQFTPASMPVFPQNKYERSYAICILLCGILGLSSCVSSITGLVMQLRNRASAETARQSELRAFLNQNKISMSLTQQIWNFLKTNRQSHEVRLREELVELLQTIPDNIRLKIRCEMYMPTLDEHPLIHALTNFDVVTVHHICMKTISQDTLLPGQEHFAKGRMSKGVTFVCDGSLIYSTIKRPAIRLPKNRKQMMCRGKSPIANSVSGFNIVDTGAWIAEATLWMPRWMHCGWLESLSVCELFLLHADEFNNYFKGAAPVSRHEVKRYHAYFQAWVHDHRCTHLSDLYPDKDDISKMVEKSFKGQTVKPARMSYKAKVGALGPSSLLHMLSAPQPQKHRKHHDHTEK